MTAQAIAALKGANDIRIRRAAEKRRIKTMTTHDGRREVADLIENPPDWLLSEKVGTLIQYADRTGHAYTLRVLHAASNPYWPIGENTRVGKLTEPQRAGLVSIIRNGFGT